MSEKTPFIIVQTWTVRVWYNAYDDEAFIDEMPDTEYNFHTKEEALAFKKAFNEKFWNHGGWKPRILENDCDHNFGSEYVAGEPAEGPYERGWYGEFLIPQTFSVEEALNAAYVGAEIWGMEEE